MKITRLERTVVCVPFLSGILSPPEYEEFSTSYPAPLGQRRQDVLRIHTDDGLTGIGMSGPYYGERADTTPDVIGKDPLEFEPRNLGGGGYNIALLDLIGKAIGWPLCRVFGGKFQEHVLVDYWISRMGPEASANAARCASLEGFKGIKIKCKIDDLFINNINIDKIRIYSFIQDSTLYSNCNFAHIKNQISAFGKLNLRTFSWEYDLISDNILDIFIADDVFAKIT